MVCSLLFWQLIYRDYCFFIYVGGLKFLKYVLFVQSLVFIYTCIYYYFRSKAEVKNVKTSLAHKCNLMSEKNGGS